MEGDLSWEVWLQKSWRRRYPFLNMEVENYPKWQETNIGDTAIFHFHDYGRKGIMQITSW